MNTRALIGAYQKANSLTIDCWPSETVLTHLRAKVAGDGCRAPASGSDGAVPQRRTRPWRAIAGIRGAAPAPAVARGGGRRLRRHRAVAEPHGRRPRRAASSRGSGRRRRRAASRAPLFERAIAGFVPDPDVHRAGGAPARAQQVARAPTSMRPRQPTSAIDAGRRARRACRRCSTRIEAAYGVDRHILLAIWGIESAYGTAKGSRNVMRSLATLAMADARRAALLDARSCWPRCACCRTARPLPTALVGSWAGAMGHTQFIPSTYSAHAVDFDKDGRRDIWDDGGRRAGLDRQLPARPPAGAAGAPWGFEVILPAGLRLRLVGARPHAARWPSGWRPGVQAAGRRRDPACRAAAAARAAGRRARARFLVSRNFRALLQIQPFGGLCARGRPSRRPHRRRRAARDALAGRRPGR